MTYLFVDTEGRIHSITNEAGFKCAVLDYAEYYHGKDDLFAIALSGCRTDDECVKMHNHFYPYVGGIEDVYEIKYVIYKSNAQK